MTKESKLSIIVPVYNGEKYIENTVRSLLSSSYQNLELLLIDDGSTDESLALCQRLSQTDPRIRVYHKENGGIGDARNFGLTHADGDYIGFCDQDDIVSEKMYERMLERIAFDGSQSAICGAYRQKRNGGKVVFEQYTDEVYDKPAIADKLLLPLLFQGFATHANDDIKIYMNIWKCVISKKLINDNKLKFRTFITHEDDFIMLLQLFLCADKISTLSDFLYYWNTNTDSETHHSTEKYLKDLDERQHSLTDYVTKQLADHGFSRQVLDEYLYVQQCRNALQQLDNLAAFSPKNAKQTAHPRSFKLLHTKMERLRHCGCISYLQSAPVIVPPKKGFVRNTVIIWLLRRKNIIAAYFLNQLINAIRSFVEKYQITEKLERRLKERKR